MIEREGRFSMRGNLGDSMRQYLAQHPIRTKIIRGFGFSASERLVRILLNVGVQFLMARRLGPEIFGEISLVTKFVGIFMSIPIFGLDEIVVRELVKEPAERRRSDIVKSIIALRFGLAFVAYAILIVSLLAFPREQKETTELIIFYGLVYFLYPLITFELLFQRSVELRRVFEIRTIGSLGISVLRVIACILLLPVNFFISFNLLEYVYLSVGMATTQFKQLKSVARAQIDGGLIKKLTWEALPLALSSFILLVDQRCALIFVERFANHQELGVFAISLTIMDVCQYFPIAIGIATFPALVYQHGSSASGFRLKIQTVFNGLFMINLFFLVANLLLGRFALNLLLGEKYSKLSDLLNLVFVVNFFLSWNLIRVRWFAINHRLKQWLVFSTCILVVSIVMQYCLTRDYGTLGTYYAWIAAQLFSNLVGCFIFEEIRESTKAFFIAPFSIGRYLAGKS